MILLACPEKPSGTLVLTRGIATKHNPSKAGSDMSVPTLDALLDRLSTDVPFKPSMVELCRRVAAGERNTKDLPDNTVILAFQSLYILLKHIESQSEQSG